MTEPRRWTLWRDHKLACGYSEWYLEPVDPHAAEAVEVMPVSEHEALREAARAVVDALHEGWFTSVDHLREVLDLAANRGEHG